MPKSACRVYSFTMDKEDKVLKIKDSEKNTKGISPEMDALLEDIESAPPQKSKRTYKRKPKVVNKDLKKAEAGDLSEKELKYQDFLRNRNTYRLWI